MSSNDSLPSVGSSSSHSNYQLPTHSYSSMNDWSANDWPALPTNKTQGPPTSFPLPSPRLASSHFTSTSFGVPPASALAPTQPATPRPASQVSTDLNVYATPFTSSRYKGLNTSLSDDVLSEGPEAISYSTYVYSFAGSSILNPHALSSWLALTTVPFIPSPPLSYPSSYAFCFNSALGLELRAQITEAEGFSRYKVPLTPSPRHQAIENLYLVPVHGLSEESPKVEIGDTIILRQLILGPNGEPQGMDAWVQASAHGTLGPTQWGKYAGYAPGATRARHVARVWGVNKRDENILVRLDGVQIHGIAYTGFTFNVVFLVQPSIWEARMRAVEDAELGLNVMQITGLVEVRGVAERLRADPRLFQYRHWLTGDGYRDKKPQDLWAAAEPQWWRRILFPEPMDGEMQTKLWVPEFRTMTWFDQHLNYEQKKAVVAIKERKWGRMPFLISGPPGTGKTKTLVAIALQLFYGSTDSRILICAPSDQAADIIAQRLAKTITAKEMFRLNTPSRNFTEVPEDLLMFSYAQGQLFFIPPLKKLLSYRIIVTTCLGADVLVQARITNRDLYSLESSILSALHPDDPALNRIHFHALLVDEAAQAIEPDILIPLTVIAPPLAHDYPLLIMAGDANQLPPRLSSSPQNIALATSLFERLLTRPAYGHHPLSRGNSHRTPVLTQAMLPIPFPPFVNLVRNYRSHPAILGFPNHWFYNNTLLPCAEGIDLLAECSVFPRPGVPVLFAAHGGTDDCLHDDRSGWYNTSEAHRAVQYVKNFAFSAQITQRDICVMSPFRAQVTSVRKLLRAAGLWQVDVGPVEAFQGKERGVVIFLTTRGRVRFLAEDQQRGVGVVGQPRQVNVGITRAKWGLVVLGNPWVLEGDRVWKEFMGFCWRVGAWEDDGADTRSWVGEVDARSVNAWKPGEVGEGEVSAFEKGLGVFERVENQNGEGRILGGREDGVWASGVEAEEIVAAEEGFDGMV